MYSVTTLDPQQDIAVSRQKPISITIFADASFCPKTKAAGWGAWAKRDGWQAGRFFGGPFRRPMPDAMWAELCALASVIWQLDHDGHLSDVVQFMLQSDCLPALSTIQALPGVLWSSSGAAGDSTLQPRPPRKIASIAGEALDAIKTATFGRRILLRHVKGHRAGTARGWVNNQCDAEARRHMQARRAELGA